MGWFVAGSKAVQRTTNELAHEAECNYVVMVPSAKTNSASPGFAEIIQLGRDATERETRKQKDKRQLRLVLGLDNYLAHNFDCETIHLRAFQRNVFLARWQKGNKNVCRPYGAGFVARACA